MSIIEVTEENFKEEVLDYKDKKVIVDFSAEWCGPCVKLGILLQKILLEFSENFKFTKLDVDECDSLCKTYDISGIPAIFVFKNGQIIDKKIGLLSEDKFKEWLNSL